MDIILKKKINKIITLTFGCIAEHLRPSFDLMQPAFVGQLVHSTAVTIFVAVRTFTSSVTAKQHSAVQQRPTMPRTRPPTATSATFPPLRLLATWLDQTNYFPLVLLT